MTNTKQPIHTSKQPINVLLPVLYEGDGSPDLSLRCDMADTEPMGSPTEPTVRDQSHVL